MRVAFYIRVSKSDRLCKPCAFRTKHPKINTCPQCGQELVNEQSLENQLYDLPALKQVEGWPDDIAIFSDNISGAKDRSNRPGFDELLTRAEAGEFDIVAAWSLDRMGRDMEDLIKLNKTARRIGFTLFFHKDRIDTSTAAGEMYFHISAAFAQFERRRISERTKQALTRLRAEGVTLGRPKETDPEIEARIRKLYRSGKGIHTIRKEIGCGASTVQRVLGERKRR